MYNPVVPAVNPFHETRQLLNDTTLVNLREGVHHGSHRRFISGANVVKIHHALHSTCLHAPDDGLGVFAEQCGCFGCEGEKADREELWSTPEDEIKPNEVGSCEENCTNK